MRSYRRDARGRFASGGGGSAPRRLSFQRVYHGTTPAAAASIKRTGFKVDPDGVYGPGAYAGTKAVAGMYGKARVAVRVSKRSLVAAAGSSRQVRAVAEARIPKGQTVRFPHKVGDTGKEQAAYVIPQGKATKGIDRRSVVRARKPRRRKPK